MNLKDMQKALLEQLYDNTQKIVSSETSPNKKQEYLKEVCNVFAFSIGKTIDDGK